MCKFCDANSKGEILSSKPIRTFEWQKTAGYRPPKDKIDFLEMFILKNKNNKKAGLMVDSGYGYRWVDIDYCPFCRKEAGRVIVLGIILMILLIGMLAILEYYKGCEDTERAYKTKSCDKCANWKTINCPNSSECFSTVDKPYFKIKEESYDK